MLVNMARAHSKVEKGEKTAKVLVRVSRPMFSKHGFSSVSAESIVEAAGLTRGALYHHFNGKLGLFEAVFIDCEREIATRIEMAAQLHRSSIGQLIAGSHAFLDACIDPKLRRIVIEDAPSVLGWPRWREIDAIHGLALLRNSVERIHQEQKLHLYDVEALVYLLSGAMNELAMWVTKSANSRKQLTSAKKNLELVIRSIFESAI